MVSHIALSGGLDGSVKIWDLSHQTVLKHFEPHTSSVCALAVNPAGNLLYSGGKDCVLQTWDLISVCQVATLEKRLKEITGLEVSSNETLLAIANRSVSIHFLLEIELPLYPGYTDKLNRVITPRACKHLL